MLTGRGERIDFGWFPMETSPYMLARWGLQHYTTTNFTATVTTITTTSITTYNLPPSIYHHQFYHHQFTTTNFTTTTITPPPQHQRGLAVPPSVSPKLTSPHLIPACRNGKSKLVIIANNTPPLRKFAKENQGQECDNTR